jgi:hypothetical protein
LNLPLDGPQQFPLLLGRADEVCEVLLKLHPRSRVPPTHGVPLSTHE